VEVVLDHLLHRLIRVFKGEPVHLDPFQQPVVVVVDLVVERSVLLVDLVVVVETKTLLVALEQQVRQDKDMMELKHQTHSQDQEVVVVDLVVQVVQDQRRVQELQILMHMDQEAQ
jgi:hypothetical protein